MTARPAHQKHKRTMVRTLITPEGVPLNVELADRGDRAGALMIDLAILFASMIAIFVFIGFTTGLAGLGRFGLILILLALFLIRNFYFMFFELKWQGQTPGKRKLGIKVIDRFGKPLTSEAIFARNMIREIEIFIPMGILLSGDSAGISGWMQFFSFVWAMILVCLPFTNKDNLRAGDLIAGTLVVRAPRTLLAKDVLGALEKGETWAQDQFVFKREHLAAYGVFELQTLEDLLRNMSNEGDEKRLTAGRTIIKKIGYGEPVADTQMNAFLGAYYNALRKHLEGGLLMGYRKENKFDNEK